MTDKVKTDGRVIERINAKRPPKVATEAVAEEDLQIERMEGGNPVRLSLKQHRD